VLTHFPGLARHLSETLRTRLLKDYLPPEGAWWLRDRVQNIVPVHLATNVTEARCERTDRATLRMLTSGRERRITVDHVVAGTGYDIDVERLAFLDARLRDLLDRSAGSPRLNSKFESSVAGLHFIGPLSQGSFGPLFRFVVGADYTARTVSAYLAGSHT
jgi:FAD-dependent urate hydroxylase